MQNGKPPKKNHITNENKMIFFSNFTLYFCQSNVVKEMLLKIFQACSFYKTFQLKGQANKIEKHKIIFAMICATNTKWTLHFDVRIEYPANINSVVCLYFRFFFLLLLSVLNVHHHKQQFHFIWHKVMLKRWHIKLFYSILFIISTGNSILLQ